MKEKIYLIAVYASIFSSTTAYGDTCPPVHAMGPDLFASAGWQAEWIDNKPVPLANLVFQEVRISGMEGNCRYVDKNKPQYPALILHNRNIHSQINPSSTGYGFINPKNLQRHPGGGEERCQATDVNACAFGLRVPLLPFLPGRIQTQPESKRGQPTPPKQQPPAPTYRYHIPGMTPTLPPKPTQSRPAPRSAPPPRAAPPPRGAPPPRAAPPPRGAK